MTNKLTLVNRSKFQTEQLREIALGLLAGQLAPSFYLIVEELFSCRGVTLSNLDKPTIILFPKDLGDFAEIFVHELTHIQQHEKNYSDEKEAKERELVIDGESYNK